MLNKNKIRKIHSAVEQGKRYRASTISVVFFVRNRSKRIQLRVVINGKKKAEKSTGIDLRDPSKWDPANTTIVDDEVATLRLQSLKEDIFNAYAERLVTKRSLDPEIIIHVALGLREHDQDTTPTVIDALGHWITQKEKLLGNGLSFGSLTRYKQTNAILAEFITFQYGARATLGSLTPAVEYDLWAYLKGEKRYGHNYAVKIIQYFKSILTYSVAHNWIDRNVLAAVRLTRNHKEVKTLSMSDLDLLIKAHFVEQTLNHTKDVFLFCCYTGLAYTDVASLKQEHIIQVDGITCILKNRDKSGQQSFVPLFPEAFRLLEQYKEHPLCLIKGVLLPVLSNQKMNNALKIIGNTVGIKETLHTHMARKTFTMYAEERGFNLDQMAIMLGHSRSNMTERHYLQRRRDPVLKVFKEIMRNDADDQAQKAS